MNTKMDNAIIYGQLGKRKQVSGQVTAIFFIQSSSAAAFAVFYSGLSLFLTQKTSYSKESAAIITGLFLSFNYFLPLIGGMIANRIISLKLLYCLGTLFSFIGCLFLAYNIDLYIGLSLFLMNSLVTNVCLNMFITKLYDNNQVIERRVTFIWNYVGMNLGFLIGYFFTGYSSIANNYFGLFIAMAIILIVSLWLTLVFIKENKPNIKNSFVIIKYIFELSLMMILLTGVLYILFYYSNFIQHYITSLSLIVLIGLIAYSFKSSNKIGRYNHACISTALGGGLVKR
jgi:dipeptide/tripeptide permease